MKITRGSLRAIIKEMQEDFVEFGDEKYSRDDLLGMISDYSKELTGRRDHSAVRRLQNAPIDQISKHYEDMFDSPEAMEVRAKFEKEDQQKADRAVGMQRDEDPMERMPHRQGMGRRVEAVNSLKALIREMVISENKMLDIITNPYEDVDDVNILANYAHNDDMQGALKDKELQYYINNNEAGMLVDDSKGWLHLVGDEKQMGPAPEGWDLDKVYDFIADFEDEAYKAFSQKDKQAHASLPNKVEREIIGSALTQSYVMPDEIKGLEFQIRRKGGKPSNINIEDDSMVSNIRAEDAERKGLTLDDIIKVLQDNGAKERKKQKPIRHTPPMYD